MTRPAHDLLRLPRMRRRLLLEAAPLAVVCVAAFLLFSYNNDFLLGLHLDEAHKVVPVLEGRDRFTHPQLLIDLVKLAHWLTGATTAQALAETGRAIAALSGVLLVVFTHLLARRLRGPAFGLAAAALTAATPIVAMHAHYLKEDIFLAPFFVGAIWAYLRMVERRTSWDVVALGVFLGLAVSAKLVGALVLPALVLAALLQGAPGRGARLRALAAATAIGAVLGIVLNYAVFLSPWLALSQFSEELRHGVSGHTLKIWPTETYFAYHFRYSLVPGLTWPVAILFLGGLVSGLLPRTRFSRAETTVLIALAVFYLVHEISPTKPFPGSIRYMVPLAPLAVIFALRAVDVAIRAVGSRWRPVAGAVSASLVLVAGVQSFLLVRDIEDDTRLEAHGVPVPYLAEIYTYSRFWGPKPANQIRAGFVGWKKWDDLVETDVRFVVISSFVYRRFLFGQSLPDQRPAVYRAAALYERLLACPGRTIKPRYRTFAFSNPIVRIVDLEACRAKGRASGR